MKKLGMIMLAVISFSAARAQLVEEFLLQKETALRYGAEQVAALRAYGAVLQKGFAIVNGGLQTLDALKKGDWEQHLVHIARLGKVNPYIKTFAHYRETEQLGTQTQILCRQYGQWLFHEPYLQPEEKRYGMEVYGKLSLWVQALLEQLASVAGTGAWELEDRDRLHRINVLYAQMAECYQFARHFEAGCRQLAGQRRQAQKEGNVLKKFGVH